MNKKTLLSACGGALTGISNGLFGGGGGMIAVPYLKGVAGLDARRAHATAIAVVLPASFVSCLVYLLFGFLPLPVLLPVALGVSAGGYLGAKLLNEVNSRVLTFVFSLVMLAAGVRMLLL